MKYLLLIYGEEKTWSGPELEKCYQESTQLVETLKAEGTYLASAPLEPAKTATTVRVRDGKPLVTDGPFIETREQLFFGVVKLFHWRLEGAHVPVFLLLDFRQLFGQPFALLP